MKDKDMLPAEQIRSMGLNNQSEQWKLRYFAALDGVRAAQRGVKRLQRKLEARDAYVKEAEKLFHYLEDKYKNTEGGNFMTEVLQEVRQNLGLVKKPRPDGK